MVPPARIRQGAGTMTLTVEQRRFYDENGFILAPGLLTADEAADLRAEAHAIAAEQGAADATWGSVRSGDTRLTHCHDVHFRSAAFTRLLVDPRFTGVAQAIIGPNVQLHHTKMFVKPPERGSPFPMHQDFPYFPHRDHSMIAAIVHLDDAPDEKGCLRVYPGSHKLGPLPAIGEDHHLPEDRFPLDGATPVPARAGDVVFFSYLLAHGSGVNRSGEPRTTVLVQLRDPADPPLVEKHGSRGQGMMLAGVDPTAGAFRFAWEGQSA